MPEALSTSLLQTLATAHDSLSPANQLVVPTCVCIWLIRARLVTGTGEKD